MSVIFISRYELDRNNYVFIADLNNLQNGDYKI